MQFLCNYRDRFWVKNWNGDGEEVIEESLEWLKIYNKQKTQVQENETFSNKWKYFWEEILQILLNAVPKKSVKTLLSFI